MPHGYEEIDLPIRERSQLSQASTKSEAKLKSAMDNVNNISERLSRAFLEILSTQATLDKKVLSSFIVHRLTWLPAATAKKEGGKMTKTLR